MGYRGPVGKRSEERQRKNAPDIPLVKVDVANVLQASVVMPEPNEKWHPVAERWYRSLSESAQCIFFEPSDWAVAYMTAESISRDMKPQVVGINEETGEPVLAKVPLKGASLSAYTKIFGALLMTEGDRRRASVEITRTSQIEMTMSDSDTVDLASRRDEAIGN